MVWPIIREMRSFRVASSYFGRGIRESTKGGVLVWRRQNAPFCLPSYPPYVLMSSRAGGERGGRTAGRQFSMSAIAWLRKLSQNKREQGLPGLSRVTPSLSLLLLANRRPLYLHHTNFGAGSSVSFEGGLDCLHLPS